MLSLPSLAPQDSYTLWYTSSTAHPPPIPEPSNNPADHLNPPQAQLSRRHQNASNRTPLARLRMDEEYIAIRKSHIISYGSTWLKPPGIPKSLHQLREEEREMKEHQEALRREQLAQELAEAEGGDELLQGEGADPEEEEGGRDLDDEIPDADITRDVDNEDDDDDDAEEEDEIEDLPQGVLAQRLPDRETLVEAADAFDEEEEENNSQMLQEEDLYHEPQQGDTDVDMLGGVDLDADIPSAEEGGYEHTDTEEELSSSEEEEEEESVLLQTARNAGFTASMVRSDGTQNSMDLSSILEQSSPQRRRR